VDECKPLPGGRVTVYFAGEGDLRTATKKDVRTALTWQGAGPGGGWFIAGTDEAVEFKEPEVRTLSPKPSTLNTKP
jgi:hypothetical protein